MTAFSVPYAAKRPANRPGAFLFLTLLLLAAVAAAYGFATLHNEAKITIITHKHGTYAHLDEGAQARNCLERHGTNFVYREPDGITFHFLCQSDSGNWFNVIARKIDENLYDEKTALEPKGGILTDIEKWMTNAYKASTQFKQIAVGTTVVFK